MVVESNFSTVYNDCSIQRFETFLFYSETHGKRFHKLKHKSVFFSSRERKRLENDIIVTLTLTRYYLRLPFIRFNILYDCDFSAIFLRKLDRFVLFNEGSIGSHTILYQFIEYKMRNKS